MASYQFIHDSPAYPAGFGTAGVFRRTVDVPDLIANGGLALAATPTVATSLASTGFATSDILEVFQVPLGFALKEVAVRVVTANTATADIDVGVTSATETNLLTTNPNGFMGTCALQTATWKHTLKTDEDIGTDNYLSAIYVTDGSIDIVFNTAAALQVIFDIACAGYRFI